MTKSATKHPEGCDTEIEAHFEKYPEIQRWKNAIVAATSKAEFALDGGDHLKGGERLAYLWNCMIDVKLAFVDANHELCPSCIDRAAFARWVLDLWDEKIPRRSLSLGEKRAKAVSIAYENGLRLSLVGSNDTPMEAARLVAAVMEGLSLETGPEAIRKSIQRFRNGLEDEELISLNRETLKLEITHARSVLLRGLPNRRGRPPSHKSIRRET
jgi:hypothetical protein